MWLDIISFCFCTSHLLACSFHGETFSSLDELKLRSPCLVCRHLWGFIINFRKITPENTFFKMRNFLGQQRCCFVSYTWPQGRNPSTAAMRLGSPPAPPHTAQAWPEAAVCVFQKALGSGKLSFPPTSGTSGPDAEDKDTYTPPGLPHCAGCGLVVPAPWVRGHRARRFPLPVALCLLQPWSRPTVLLVLWIIATHHLYPLLAFLFAWVLVALIVQENRVQPAPVLLASVSTDSANHGSKIFRKKKFMSYWRRTDFIHIIIP